jgi:hypothetical protein
MVAVFNKEVLSWYLITLKIKETVDANLRKSPSPQWQSLPYKLRLANGTTSGGEGEALPRQAQAPRLSPIRAQSPAHSPKPQDSEWVVTIRGKLAQARAEEAACPWARLSVYRVPKTLREGDERAYMPQVVSIGPLHAGKRRLREMEHHKWRALHHVLKRTGHDVTTYLDALRPMEDRVRGCYDGRVAWMPSNEFVQCLVLDGTFVLELFQLDGRQDLGQQLSRGGRCHHVVGHRQQLAVDLQQDGRVRREIEVRRALVGHQAQHVFHRDQDSSPGAVR